MKPRLDIPAVRPGEGEVGADGGEIGAAGEGGEGDGDRSSGDAGGGSTSGDGQGPSTTDDETKSELMSDDEEADPAPSSPPAVSDQLDPNQAVKYQTPSAPLTNLFAEAVKSFAQNLKEDKALFWSGGGRDARTADDKKYGEKAAELANPDALDLTEAQTLWDQFAKDNPLDSDRSQLVDGQTREYVSIISAAMANVASGKVHLMLPPNGLTKTTTWTEVEWPEILRDGNKATQIHYLDPDSEVTWLIWDRNDGYTGPWPIGVAAHDGSVFPLGKPGFFDYDKA